MRAIHKTYSYRLYPTREQEKLLSKHFGACRWVYNFCLETKTGEYGRTGKVMSRYELSAMLPGLKKQWEWLAEINSQSLQSELKHLNNAFNKFSKEKAGFPAFKNRHSRQSFECPQSFWIEGGKLSLPKFRSGIKVVVDRPAEGRMLFATVSKTAAGKYFASIATEQEAEAESKPVRKETAVGIDLGLRDFLIMSDGTKVGRSRFIEAGEKRLAHLQRKACRQQKGSNSQKKTFRRIARLHEKIANQRKDFHNKVARRLVSESQACTFCLESLDVRKMMQDRRYAKSVMDVGWGNFVRTLTYKAQWAGKNIVRIGRFEKSSKTCNSCGHVLGKLGSGERKWACPNCGAAHDMDINAARNILDFAFHKNAARAGTARCDAAGELPTGISTKAESSQRNNEAERTASWQEEVHKLHFVSRHEFLGEGV